MRKKNIVQVVCVYLAAFFIVSLGLQSESAPKETKKEIKKETKESNKVVNIAIETNKGTINGTLFGDKTPKTVENFVGLATGQKEYTDVKTGKKTKGNYYDGLVFHRVIPNFMIQGGCPRGDGTGDPGYRFEDEIVKGLTHDKPGKFSMANSGPGTNGSQFFITVAATPWLDGKHTVFGEVTEKESLDVLMAISKVKTGSMDRPVEPVVIKSVKVL
jgi:peptidyl-prolyl cis-trans isomerase A (cyclophilin A)